MILIKMQLTILLIVFATIFRPAASIYDSNKASPTPSMESQTKPVNKKPFLQKKQLKDISTNNDERTFKINQHLQGLNDTIILYDLNKTLKMLENDKNNQLLEMLLMNIENTLQHMEKKPNDFLNGTSTTTEEPNNETATIIYCENNGKNHCENSTNEKKFNLTQNGKVEKVIHEETVTTNIISNYTNIGKQHLKKPKKLVDNYLVYNKSLKRTKAPNIEESTTLSRIDSTTLQFLAENITSNSVDVDVEYSDDIDGIMNSSLILNFIKLYPTELWREHGFFTQDYLKLINPHWLQYPPALNIIHYLLGFLYTLIFISGISGNFLVIFMFIRCRSLRTPANTLIINLAISDLLMMSKTPLFIYNSLYLGPALGAFICEIYGFIGGLTGTVSIVTLAVISIDRYLVIVYPLDPNKRITGGKSKFCILIIWVYGLVFSGLPLFDVGVGKYIPEGLLTSCSFDYLSPEEDVKYFILVFFVAAWVVPFLIILFCYTRIMKVVIDSEKLARDQKSGSMSSRHCKDDENRRTEIKLAGVVVIVIFLWFVAWTPYAVVALLGITGHKDLITPFASMIPALLAKVASCIDPFVYAVTHPRFRTEIHKMFIRRRKKDDTIKDSQYSISANLSDTPDPGPPPVPPLGTPQQIRNDSLKSNTSGSIEEIMVMVDLPMNKGNLTAHSRHDVVTASAECLSSANVPKPPSWYVKPDFARTSSIKAIARHLSVKRDPIST